MILTMRVENDAQKTRVSPASSCASYDQYSMKVASEGNCRLVGVMWSST
jgi:hypothetical protein